MRPNAGLRPKNSKKRNVPPEVKVSKKHYQKLKAKSKQTVKTVLQNSLGLDWPVVNKDLEEEIFFELEICCWDLKVPICKPPWKELYKLKGEERQKYREAYRRDFMEKLLSDPDAASKYESAKEARSHLIFGFNAIMRSLEQNQLAGIVVSQDISASFAFRTFIPGCINKRVPIVPLSRLHLIKDSLAIHKLTCMGLASSVKVPSNRFYPVYKKLVKALDSLDKIAEDFESHHLTDSAKMHIDSNEENDEQNAEGDDELFVESQEEKNLNKEDKRGISKFVLSQEQIQSYHLKRTNRRERVFVPNSKKMKRDDVEEDFIEVSQETNKEKQNSRDETEMWGRVEKISETASNPTNVGLEFFLDTSGIDDVLHLGENIGGNNEEVTDKVNSKKVKMDVEEDFVQVNKATEESFEVKQKSRDKTKMQRGVEEGREINSNPTNSDLEFLMDTEGKKENVLKKQMMARYKFSLKKHKNSANGSGTLIKTKEEEVTGNEKKKKRRAPRPTYPYVPAKTARIRNNPNRKGKGRKQ